MKSQSNLDHAAKVVAAISPVDRADVALRHYLEHHRWLSPAEKRAISGAVFGYFRWVQWLDRGASLPKQLEQAGTLQARFNQDPNSVKAEALAARAVPEWLRSEMEITTAYLRQIQREPALWLRARPGSGAKLAAKLGDCHASDRSGDALRYTGQKDLFHTEQFQGGEFEIQDLASQLTGLECAPKPGQTWWDACAGEGGKTLHLADLMGNKGLIWASDRSARRLDTLKRRAARAQVFNYRTVAWEGSEKLPTKTKFDGILVDAPCSGVGTWQRNPHARWTTRPDDVRELAAIQLGLLQRVAPALKPGGRLVYAVCTLTQSETTAVAEKFSAGQAELKPVSTTFLWPQDINANGMFIAVWKRE